ncbi:MAG: group II intron reverse transcriptase/maturase [Raoultibacter sp.]
MSKTMDTVKGRQLREEGYLEMVGATPQEHPEASTCTRNSERDEFNAQSIGNAKDLLEKICTRENMRAAYKRVVQNKGAGGIDKMSVRELNGWLAENYEALINRLRTGKYKPLPVRRVEIPKEEKGKTRLLGIPTVIDRMVQQAIVQVLTPIYEPTFSEYSFGFRPNRSAHDALSAIKSFVDEGNVWVVSIDLERFFDTVNQSKLVQLLSDSLQDKRVVSLIHRFLIAGVMVDGVVQKTEEGTPQGGPLSPLLANIMLNELDKELTARGHVFVRYADDCMILKGSRKAAERALASVSKFIEGKLFLKVNRDKSYVAHISKDVKYLGYGFYRCKDELQFRPHAKSITKLKNKVRAILSRSNGWSLDYRRYRMKCLVNGWVNYFKLARMKTLLADIDEWCRRKIRCVYWKAWKRVRTKLKALQRLGIKKNQAWQWANSRKAYWRIAGSWVLTRALPNAKLEELGWTSFSKRYQQVGCQN